MPQIVECPGCGKSLWIGDAGSGLITVCSECGTAVEAPAAARALRKAPGAGPAPIVWAGVAAVVIATAATAWFFLGRSPAPLTPVSANTPPPAATPSTASWDSQNLSLLMDLKADGDRLAADGQWSAARERYRKFRELVGDRKLVMPELRRAAVEVVASEQSVVDALLRAASAPKPATVATESTSPATPSLVPAPLVSAPPKKPAVAAPPPRSRVPRAAQVVQRGVLDLSDDEIGHAIQRGVDSLLARFRNGKLGDVANADSFTEGENALAVYALLQASLAIKDDRLNPKGPLIKSMLDALKAMPIERGPETYTRAIRATALAVYNRPEDVKALRTDVNWLLGCVSGGGFGYFQHTGRTDNSNAQYGLLGVWAGAEAGIEISQGFWQSVEKYWAERQLEDGQWGYSMGPERSGFAMDCAGTASLFITHDFIDATRVGKQLGRPPFSKALERAMSFIEQGDHSVTLDLGTEPWFVGYNLYGLERVGLASGMKHLGNHDWYRELARKVVNGQAADGTWPQLGHAMQVHISYGGVDIALYDQCYALLFLSRGRHPVLFSKLRYEGFWANRPRDLANLARYASRELERPLNWQIVGSQRGWTDWMDSPVLYIAGHEAPTMTDADYDNLRSFAQAGGTIYLNSDGSSEAFTKFVNDLSKRLFPTYEIATLPTDHPIYTIVFPMTVRPVVRGVSNGARLLLVHTPGDPAFSWQQRADKSRPDAFQLGLNLFVYASGKADFRNRLTTPVLPEPTGQPTHTVPFARVRYAGNWDPEPAAAPRLSRYLWQQTGWSLDLRPVDAAALSPETAPIAHLTGTAHQAPTATEIAAIKNYVESGGVLVIDSCGGNAAFAESVESSLFPRAFPGAIPRIVDASHPLLNGKSECSTDLGHTRIRLGRATPPTTPGVRMFRAGKGHVIYSPIDITSGLLGTSTAGITGFKFEYAQALMKNIILWTEDGQPE